MSIGRSWDPDGECPFDPIHRGVRPDAGGGRARPLLRPASMPGGRATPALAGAAAVRRLLLAAAAPALSLIVVGCTLVTGLLHDGSGGGSSTGPGGEGDGDDDGLLFATTGAAPTRSAGPGQGGGAVVLDIGFESFGGSFAITASSSAASGSTSAAATSGAGGGGLEDCDPNEVPDTSSAVPPLLSATGLYQNIATKTLAAGVLPFTPLFPLWADGAEKRRWVHLPGCAKIDTGDMDRWSMPVGTKVWKMFIVGGARLETRYIHRYSAGPNDFVFQSYQWDAAATDATPVPIGGVKNANGTTHDIPGAWECAVCHGHAPERVLGLSALQLSHAGPGLTVASLSAAGRLTVPSAGFFVPGDATARAALGYLHGNCAHCHNPSPSAVAFPTAYSLKLLTGAATVAQTDAVVTAVGVAPEKFVHPGITHRITAGDPTSSCVAYRMSVRGSNDAMPALGTKVVDPDGLAQVTAWISELSP